MVREAERVQQAISAGGVVYRPGTDCIDVVVCGRRRDRLWALPKGTPEPGETLEHTALREVCEETGLSVAIVEALGEIRYQFTEDGTRYDKRVAYFLMSSHGGSTDDHDGEFDDVRWLCSEEALRLLTYPNERAVLRRAMRAVEERGSA